MTSAAATRSIRSRRPRIRRWPRRGTPPIARTPHVRDRRGGRTTTARSRRAIGGARPCGAPVSSRKRWLSASAISGPTAPAPRRRQLIASGRPSSRWQMYKTSASSASLGVKPGRTAWERSTNSSPARTSSSGSTAHTCSPLTARRSRLVARPTRSSSPPRSARRAPPRRRSRARSCRARGARAARAALRRASTRSGCRTSSRRRGWWRRRGDLVAAPHGRQLAERDMVEAVETARLAIVGLAVDEMCQFHRQPGLADAARTRDGDRSRVPSISRELAHEAIAAMSRVAGWGRIDAVEPTASCHGRGTSSVWSSIDRSRSRSAGDGSSPSSSARWRRWSW